MRGAAASQAGRRWTIRPWGWRRFDDFHSASYGTYGAPRVHAELRNQGMRVGCKHVARLMCQAGLAGVSRRKRIRTTSRDSRTRAAPNLVEHDLSTEPADRLWVADITYAPTRIGFLYFAVVLDAFSRRIVGWAMATHLKAALVLEAMEIALAQRRPEGGIYHSDQGSH